jgi:prefoldin subunit 5
MVALVASLALAALTACSNDEAAIRVLQQVTVDLVDDVEERNEELAKLEEQLLTCQANVAQAQRRAVVIRATDVTHDVPALVGEPTIQSLEAHKAALDKTLTKQEAALEGLRDETRVCGEELAALQAKPKRKRTVAKAPAPPPEKQATSVSADNKGAALEFNHKGRTIKLGGNWK